MTITAWIKNLLPVTEWYWWLATCVCLLSEVCYA